MAPFLSLHLLSSASDEVNVISPKVLKALRDLASEVPSEFFPNEGSRGIRSVVLER